MAKATILIADNDHDFSEAQAELLEMLGYEIVVAASPSQAKDILLKGGIDLAILDIRLADDNDSDDDSGLRVAQEIAPTIPKIILTGFPSYKFAQQALLRNPIDLPTAIDFLSKADGSSAIIDAIEKIIATFVQRELEEQISNRQEELVSYASRQFYQAHSFFEQQLAKLGLSQAIIENEIIDELENSLERVNDAIKFPEAFGTLKLKMSSTGSLIVTDRPDFHYEIGILPTLLERKKLILERMKVLGSTPSANESRVLKTQNGVNEQDLLPIKILFLAANPKDTPQLRLDQEMRAIDLSLNQTTYRHQFDIKQHWAVRIFDLQGYLLRHRPHIVHFSGHGSDSSHIILEDNSGHSRPISSRSLGQLFAILKDNIRCVVLNACYSEQQAQAIAEHIDCVIGMARPISDSAALSFATSFYQGLGFGRSIKTAFDLGCLQIDLEDFDEQHSPKLLAYKCNPANLVFTSSD